MGVAPPPLPAPIPLISLPVHVYLLKERSSLYNYGNPGLMVQQNRKKQMDSQNAEFFILLNKRPGFW